MVPVGRLLSPPELVRPGLLVELELDLLALLVGVVNATEVVADTFLKLDILGPDRADDGFRCRIVAERTLHDRQGQTPVVDEEIEVPATETEEGTESVETGDVEIDDLVKRLRE